MTLMQPSISLLADFWLPGRGSTVAAESDWLFNIIFWICIFFFFLILGLMVWFGWKYRHREGIEEGDAPKHNTALELTWTLIPTVIVLFIFYYGFKGFMNLAVAPPNPYEVVVTARTWAYSFTYPNGHIDTNLHVPMGVPVQVVLTSEDVIHGFYVPEFRVKKDIVPGRYNKLWFQSDSRGTYDLYCTQYCGQGHSTMRAQVVVEPFKEFSKWLEVETEKDTNGPPVELGQRAYAKRGCSQCHSIDGTKVIGPTWKNMWGNPVAFDGGGSLAAVDEPYVRESILQPAAKIVAGYQNVMPSYQGILKDKEIGNLIAFMKSISDKGGPTMATPTMTTAPVGAPPVPSPTPNAATSQPVSVPGPLPPSGRQ